jgi:hypothetical protein
MSEELRNKLRFLRHIPVTCSFEVAELELSNQIISTKTRYVFEPQLLQRKRKRAQRARNEKRREKRIEVEENKLLGKYPGLPKSLRIESDFHFPAVGNNASVKAIGYNRDAIDLHFSSESGADSITSRASSPQVGAASAQSRNEYASLDEQNVISSISNQSETSTGGMSFAKILREGPARSSKPITTVSRSETYPGILSLYPIPKPRKPAHSDSEPELEDYVPPPPKQSIGDALAQALQQACTLDSGSAGNDVSTNSTNQASGKKKSRKFKGNKISLSSGARPNL